MPRGYRCILVAFVGWLSLAANHAYAEGGNKQTAAENTVAASLQNIASSYDQATERTKRAEKEEAECGPEKYGSSTDLCAQWKAADAATNSAWWAWVSGLVGVGSLVGVLVALGIALHSNWIARDTAKRQLRAYVHLKTADLGRCGDNNFPTDCDHPVQRFAEVEIRNYGQTPALNMVSVTAVGIKPFPPTEVRPLGEIPDWVDRSTSDLPPGRESGMPMEVKASGWFHDRLMTGELAVYFWGEVTYEDVFGEKHRTVISLVSHGDSYKRGCFTVAKEGNDAD